MEPSGDHRNVLRLVFAASLASLSYELALMRSFSISLWYHFAFMPVGLLMGLPFPLGIGLIAASSPRLVPWAWAVNGCFSVVAPILAVMLALSVGYRSVLL